MNRGLYCRVIVDGFGLMAEFIGFFDAASECTLQFTLTHILVSTDTLSLTLLGSGFQRRTFPFLWVSEIS
jgi:hypothetical protein